MTSIPTYTGLDTALRGLEAAQAGIDTTGNNIANASTPGYSEEVVDQTENTPYTLPGFSNVTGAGIQLGTGVDVTTISRVRDQFLDVQYRAQNSATSNASTTSATLQQVQAALDEPTSDGLSSQLQAFWSAWSSLATDPQSLAAKQAVVGAGTTVAQTINSLSNTLTTIQSQTEQQYTALTQTDPPGEVLSDAQQIASLNASISQQEAAGQTPNTSLDQRDELIDQLSSLATVSVSTQPNGMVNISFGDAAQPLVSGTTVNWPQSLTSAAGGQLGALQTLAGPNGTIAGYQTELNSVATQLISEVNSIHTATPFFSGTSAANIGVAVSAANVQTSSTGTAGGNDVALALADLGGSSSDQATQSYDALVSGIGSDVQASQSTQTNAQALLTAISNQRQSTSGVDLDQEMTNLINYQQAYQASARVMTTMDDTLDTLINHTGEVGL